MKKILLPIIIFSINSVSSAQIILDTSVYHKIFYDEFAYTGLGPTDTSTSTIGTTLGHHFSEFWEIKQGRPLAGSGYLDPAQLTLSSDATCSNFLQLTESTNFYIDTTGDTFWHKSASIATQYLYGNSYGLWEAKMRFPAPPATHAAQPTVWTFNSQKTEIDLCDQGYYFDYIPTRVIDWYYRDSKDSAIYNNEPYGVTNTVTAAKLNTLISSLDPIGISNLYSDWHVYSFEWSPTTVSFFIDYMLMSSIPYSEVRTYPGPTVLIFWLATTKSVDDGQHMEIDWVKIWKQNCLSGTAINVSSVIKPSTTSVINPGLYKRDSIIASSASLVTIDTTEPTLLKARITTIESNFLADESRRNTGRYPLPPYTADPLNANFANTDFIYHPIYKNAFFEITAINCDDAITESDYKVLSPGTKNFTDIVNNDYKNVISDTTTSARNPQINNYSQIEVYPNPTRDKINISYPCASAGYLNISIKEVSGRLLYLESISCNESKNIQHTVDISSFAPGVYFVDLTLNAEHVVKKIVKL